MHQRTQIKLSPPTNRNSPQKHVWRAKIVLLTADGHGTAEIMRRTGKAKTVIWRWQGRFGHEGIAGLWRDKTRPSRASRLLSAESPAGPADEERPGRGAGFDSGGNQTATNWLGCRRDLPASRAIGCNELCSDYMFTPQQLHFLTVCLLETRDAPGCVVEAGCAYGAMTAYLSKFMSADRVYQHLKR
jgi:Winged helix-turn helix